MDPWLASIGQNKLLQHNNRSGWVKRKRIAIPRSDPYGSGLSKLCQLINGANIIDLILEKLSKLVGFLTVGLNGRFNNGRTSFSRRRKQVLRLGALDFGCYSEQSCQRSQ